MSNQPNAEFLAIEIQKNKKLYNFYVNFNQNRHKARPQNLKRNMMISKVLFIKYYFQIELLLQNQKYKHFINSQSFIKLKSMIPKKKAKDFLQIKSKVLKIMQKNYRSKNDSLLQRIKKIGRKNYFSSKKLTLLMNEQLEQVDLAIIFSKHHIQNLKSFLNKLNFKQIPKFVFVNS